MTERQSESVQTWPEGHHPIVQRQGDTHGYWCHCGYPSCDLDLHAEHVRTLATTPPTEAATS